MADLAKLLKEILPAINDIFDKELLSSGTIHTNLAADNFGFWLTQGVPIGLIVIHFLLAVLDKRDDGRCFVPKVNGEPLMQSQVQYITEMCLDQATHHNCFDQTSGDFDEVCSSSPCNETLHVNPNIHEQSDQHHRFETLFFYRYHVWFLIAFTFLRALPQIVWRLYYAADLRKAIQDIATIAEFQHAMCGVVKLVRVDDCPQWMQSLNRMVLEEVSKRACRYDLFRAYVVRKVADICLDVLIIAALVWFQSDRTPFNNIVFVCDLHADRDNIFLCGTIQQRFLPCTVSFGLEFVITASLVFCVIVTDFMVQVYLTFMFTKFPKVIIRKLPIVSRFCGEILYWDPFISHELVLDQNDQWNEFDHTFMRSPNDLYLVGLMYRQSNVNHGHFLKMMAEKMLEQLRPAFDYHRQASYAQSHPITAMSTNSRTENQSKRDGQAHDNVASGGGDISLARFYTAPDSGFDFAQYSSSRNSQNSTSYTRL